MSCEFKLTRRVEFADTDAAGIMHFSKFFHFMEAAEHAFFRSLGFSIHNRESDGAVHWPRVHAECDYKAPVYFEDIVEVHLLVREKKKKSLVYAFTFTKSDEESATEVEIARGSLVTACVRVDPSDGKMEAVPIPAEIADKIEVAPKEMFE